MDSSTLNEKFRLEYEALVQFVRNEATAQRQEYSKYLSLPLHSRIQRGKCIQNMKLHSFLGEDRVRFICTENYSDLREGDRVFLHPNDPEITVAKGTWNGDGLLPDEREYIDIIIPNATELMALKREIESELVLDPDLIDLEESYHHALDELISSNRGATKILPLLAGVADESSYLAEEYETTFEQAEKDGFNDAQQEAIALGSSSAYCTLIQGPPGTGKTRVLANIVRNRVEKGERIMICAATHRAIHQALNVVCRVMPDFSNIAKIGVPITDPWLEAPFYENFESSPFINDAGAYVIGATPFAARGKALKGVEFDCVIVDEASQMTIPLAVMAMLSSDNYIFIGDQQQLAPVLSTIPISDASRYSIFSHLLKFRDRVLLDTTYRMNEEITTWVSENFYQEKLVSGESAASRKLSITSKNQEELWIRDALSAEHSLVWIEPPNGTEKETSREEAVITTQLVEKLFLRGISPMEIGVVTPFRRQARLIRSRLRQSRNIPRDLSQQIVVDTVERMQGQEREVIILSTAVSDPARIEAMKEFLFLYNRLNVSVSRARTKVIIVSHPNLLQGNPLDTDWQELVAPWLSLKERTHPVIR